MCIPLYPRLLNSPATPVTANDRIMHTHFRKVETRVLLRRLGRADWTRRGAQFDKGRSRAFVASWRGGLIKFMGGGMSVPYRER